MQTRVLQPASTGSRLVTHNKAVHRLGTSSARAARQTCCYAYPLYIQGSGSSSGTIHLQHNLMSTAFKFICFSDIDGTLVHYLDSPEQLQEIVGNVIWLPTSTTGRQVGTVLLDRVTHPAGRSATAQ